MSYQAYSLSVDAGSPAELYRFNYWDRVYRYCTLDGGVGNFTYTLAGGTEVFTPTTIKRDDLDTSGELSRNKMDITVPSSNEVAQLFLQAPPDGVIALSIFRFHVVDPDKGYILIYKGRILSCAFKGKEATLTSEPIFTSLRRPGLRMRYDSQCVHELYSQGPGPACRLNRGDWRIASQVLARVSASVLTLQNLQNYPAGWFTGGVFQCGDVRRMVTGNSGTSLTLMHPAPANVVGLPCYLYPGCSHTLSDCRDKFNNVPNYGGQPWIPLRNPYEGDSIFW